MKRLVLSPVTVLSVFFTGIALLHASTALPPQASTTAQTAPVSLPGPDTSGPAEKIGTQGNWVKKREWLMKSHEAFAEIQALVNQVEQVRAIFVEKLNSTNNILNVYYRELGLTEGKLNELFNSVINYLEHNRKKTLASFGGTQEHQDPDLQAKIDIVESNIKHQRLALDQLKLDMKTVEDLGKSLVDRVTRVDEHIAIVQDLFISAQTSVNELWDIIDHNKARDKYYGLKITILEKIKAEQTYLQDDLLQDFDTVTQTIVSQIGRTQEAIKKIETDGFFIKNRSKHIKDVKLKDMLSKTTTATKNTSAKRQDDVHQVVRERTLTDRLYETSIEAIAWVVRQFYWLKTLIFGGPTQALSTTKMPLAQVAIIPVVAPLSTAPTSLPPKTTSVNPPIPSA